MEFKKALVIFDTLSQETRLKALRLLVKAGEDGLAAGVLSEKLGTPHNTLSFHLTHLSNAGIISSKRLGRSIIYFANLKVVVDLLGFLIKDCCSEEMATIRTGKKKKCSIIELNDCC